MLREVWDVGRYCERSITFIASTSRPVLCIVLYRPYDNCSNDCIWLRRKQNNRGAMFAEMQGNFTRVAFPSVPFCVVERGSSNTVVCRIAYKQSISRTMGLWAPSSQGNGVSALTIWSRLFGGFKRTRPSIRYGPQRSLCWVALIVSHGWSRRPRYINDFRGSL